eukprot:CAMPEP_0179895988 /NCGR_PEP_ID=MMETSP0982-20121206/36136_1 /TAXON_ID=483367 /ORGANISM="non described non described, Strain CCMP 2436" /LENGTH=51 /DNA_ID=CAMNT_0021792729 /DNA_START=260 /DNA_END=415 /DNA_ORIENTATION=-
MPSSLGAASPAASSAASSSLALASAADAFRNAPMASSTASTSSGAVHLPCL